MATGVDTGIQIPSATIEWLTSAENPVVAVRTRRELLGESQSAELDELWAQRNAYPPVATILDAIPEAIDASKPKRAYADYQKYHGPLWLVHFLGELWADAGDERVGMLADYAFSRQLDDGAFSVNGRATGAIPCLTANVARALARLGWARDERVVAALTRVSDSVAESGLPSCWAGGDNYTLKAYCYMVAPKLLLFLAEIPDDLRPASAEAMREACVRVMREHEVFRCQPQGTREFFDRVYKERPAAIPAIREEWIAEHGPLVYAEKPGWMRFGFPLSYNSDALESLAALRAVGETWQPEYEAALELVRSTADAQSRWTLRNTFNGKMAADIEKKGQPSRWLTLRALEVLRDFAH